MMNRSTLYGEGLFETIRWRGENRKLRLHYSRLRDSASFFSIPCPSYEEFVDSIKKACGDRSDLYVKFCLFSKGEDHYAGLPKGYEVEVIVKPLPKFPKEVNLTVSSYRRHSHNPVFRHKTMNYLFNVLVKREAVRKGYYDAVVLNERDEVTECSSSNLILLRGERFYTPARESGLLWGTTLKILSEELGIEERRLTLADIERADSLFVTNSLIGVLPVVRFEGYLKNVNKEILNVMRSILSSYL